MVPAPRPQRHPGEEDLTVRARVIGTTASNNCCSSPGLGPDTSPGLGNNAYYVNKYNENVNEYYTENRSVRGHARYSCTDPRRKQTLDLRVFLSIKRVADEHRKLTTSRDVGLKRLIARVEQQRLYTSNHSKRFICFSESSRPYQSKRTLFPISMLYKILKYTVVFFFRITLYSHHTSALTYVHAV